MTSDLSRLVVEALSTPAAEQAEQLCLLFLSARRGNTQARLKLAELLAAAQARYEPLAEPALIQAPFSPKSPRRWPSGPRMRTLRARRKLGKIVVPLEIDAAQAEVGLENGGLLPYAAEHSRRNLSEAAG